MAHRDDTTDGNDTAHCTSHFQRDDTADGNDIAHCASHYYPGNGSSQFSSLHGTTNYSNNGCSIYRTTDNDRSDNNGTPHAYYR